MRIVMDTDVLVAAVRSCQGASRAWLKATLLKKVELILSVPLVLQYEDVLLQPDQLRAAGMTAAKVKQLLDTLCKVCVPVEISFLWRPILRDPDDEMVLEAAVHGQADMLLTFNERDFVGAEHFKLPILRPGPAWQTWKEGDFL